MARYLLLPLFFVLSATIGFAQTAVSGKVTDPETGEELINATIQLFKGGVFIQGAVTDFNGNYKVNVDPGTYDILCSYLGYSDKRTNGVIVKAGQTTNLDVDMGGSGGILIDEIVVTEYKVPLIDKDNTTSGAVITSKEIRALPTKNISALASTTAGLSQVDEGDAVTVRGSRSDATDYYLDGIRVSASQLPPETEIEQLQVITGGIQASYGDVTGGIISLTSKGPSSKFSGGVEVETSEYLDAFGYNQVNANVSGPIIKNKDTGKSLLGFRLSGRYRYLKDDDPPATEIYQVKDEVLADLQANPLFARGTTSVPSAENLTNEDVNILKYRPNEQNKRVDITGKLDARVTDNIDITLSGTFADTKDRITPGTRANWRLMNSHNNPTQADRRYRANFRFRHRLGGANVAAEEGATPKKPSMIQNAEYTIQVGFEKGLLTQKDHQHGDNLFNYGYVGSFDRVWTPAVGRTTYTGSAFFNEQNVLIPTFDDAGNITNIEGIREGEGVGHVSNTSTIIGFTPSTTINPTIANYNLIEEQTGVFSAINGNFNQNGDVGGIWQDMHTNVGQVFNRNRKTENDLYTFSASSSFDLLPGGSEKGTHSIQFGILYEQRYNRFWEINPRALWTLARQEANVQILGVDTTSVIDNIDYTLFTIPDFLPINGSVPIHGVAFDPNVEGQFYRNIRDVTGQGLDEYVNVDAIDPAAMSLGLFSARELIDDPRIGLDYYGYDYLGNKIGNDVTFDDFFTTRDANGVRTFPVAPFKPNYFAAYVQDKFTFNDITFRLGLRVDRYDANTKVLRDPYSLAPIMTAKDFFDQFGGERPGNIGDDYKVYVEGDPSSKTVQAFRNGDTWFFANGTEANNGLEVFPGRLAFPKLVDGVADIQSEDFNPSTSFEDYEPQINWMPRLAFSFPISDDANFFAHYDILVQRPPSNTVATALDYFNFSRTPPANNPNLRPEKTIDYEVGFRQKLSNTSAIKIAAYYKELRDMIQRRIYDFVADVNNYQSFGNIDFGTVKGFSFQYDLRRTGNISANINYTLQFADGTGSDANSQQNLLSRGNLRTLIPLNFDERHRIVATIDYRYGSGSRYTGPSVFGNDIFANTGINFQTIAVSGRPFTANEIPNRFGGEQFEGAINGARKPWTFTMNMRIDKEFSLSKSKDFPLNMIMYLRISNLLNQRNVINVYPATGSAEDDGFLLSQQGVNAIQAVSDRNPEAFLASYQWALARPDFYSLPRRIFLGAIFEF